MGRFSALLGLVPLLGLGELALHHFFAARAPDAAEYAALGVELSKLKQPGEPVVVAPAWAEPFVRQAAPAAFPLRELARPDERSFAAFLEVSLLGQSAPELASWPVEQEYRVGAFRVRRHRNLHPQPTRYDFVAAVEEGRVEVATELEAEQSRCVLGEQPRTETGGLHGHASYPRRRYRCAGGAFVGVTLIEDQDYRPRRCVLARAPEAGSLVLRFTELPAASRLVGFAGAPYFLERDATVPQTELSVSGGERTPERQRFAGAQGWQRFELAGSSESSRGLELRVRALARRSVDFCFSLEAR